MKINDNMSFDFINLITAHAGEREKIIVVVASHEKNHATSEKLSSRREADCRVNRA